MTALGVWTWSFWLLGLIFAAVFLMARDAPEGYSSVSLPRLFYFLWVLVCVLALFGLRQAAAAMVAAAAAAVVGALTFSVRPKSDDRGRELRERLEGARRALEERPGNSMSLELLGDLYSTVEHKALALEHWNKALALRSDPGLREKVAALERPTPMFHFWGAPAERDWRACGVCGAIAPRLARRCSCGAVFEAPHRWLSACVDRLCEDNGLDRLLRLSIYLLPFLFVLGIGPYLILWLAWAAASRSSERFAGGSRAGRHAVRALLLAALAGGASAGGDKLVLDPRPLKELRDPKVLMSYLKTPPGGDVKRPAPPTPEQLLESQVADAIHFLSSRDPGLQLFGAQALNSARLAAAPLAQAAREELEAAAESEDPRVREEARLALKRLDAAR